MKIIKINEEVKLKQGNKIVVLEKGDKIEILKERDTIIYLSQEESGIVIEALEWFKVSPSAKEYYSPRLIDSLIDKILRSKR